MRYTSHKVVYTVLPKRVQALPDAVLDNYIIQCIRQIDAKAFYENKLTLLKIKNGVADLPEDFIKTYGVFYNSKEPTEQEFNSLLGCIGNLEDIDKCITDSPLTASTEATDSDITVNTSAPDNLLSRYNLVNITEYDDDTGMNVTKWIFKNIGFNEYLSSNYFKNCWTPLAISDRIFTGCYVDSNSPCCISHCNYRFSLDTCNQIRTNFKDGWLKLAYLGRPTQSDGSYTIPDNMEYINVLRDGVLMYFWEDMRTNQDEGGLYNHREYEDKFYNGVAYLRGKSLIPKGAVKDRQLRNIIYADVAIANDYSRTGNSGWSGGALFNHMNI